MVYAPATTRPSHLRCCGTSSHQVALFDEVVTSLTQEAVFPVIRRSRLDTGGWPGFPKAMGAMRLVCAVSGRVAHLLQPPHVLPCDDKPLGCHAPGCCSGHCQLST